MNGLSRHICVLLDLAHSDDPFLHSLLIDEVHSLETFVESTRHCLKKEEQGTLTDEDLQALQKQADTWVRSRFACVGARQLRIKSKLQRTKARQPRKVSEGQRRMILNAYDDMVKTGMKYGAVSELANEYGVHRNLIHSIIKKHAQK